MLSIREERWFANAWKNRYSKKLHYDGAPKEIQALVLGREGVIFSTDGATLFSKRVPVDQVPVTTEWAESRRDTIDAYYNAPVWGLPLSVKQLRAYAKKAIAFGKIDVNGYHGPALRIFNVILDPRRLLTALVSSPTDQYTVNVVDNKYNRAVFLDDSAYRIVLMGLGQIPEEQVLVTLEV